MGMTGSYFFAASVIGGIGGIGGIARRDSRFMARFLQQSK
jgi:hypothetical protein